MVHIQTHLGAGGGAMCEGGKIGELSHCFCKTSKHQWTDVSRGCPTVEGKEAQVSISHDCGSVLQILRRMSQSSIQTDVQRQYIQGVLPLRNGPSKRLLGK